MNYMRKAQRALARNAAIIKEHYGLNRPVTADEIVAEIVNLKRKRAKGNLDTRQEQLAAALNIGHD